MTRSRLAATAALSMVALLVTTTGGEAQKPPRGPGGPGADRYTVAATCKTAQRTARDFAKIRSLVRHVARGRASASAIVPADGVKVVTKLIDLNTADGNNVVKPAKKSDLTNDDGIAKTKHEFDNFGNYQVNVKVKVDGETVADDTLRFGVADRESGPCDPPLTGAGY